MARKKVNRVTKTRRPRVPTGYARIELIFPQVTADRIVDHCARNNLNQVDFLKKAIYNALPVHYEVDESFVFPFGKYQGETAGAVKQFDPEYIEWCKKNINGFKSKMEPEVVRAASLPHIFACGKEGAEDFFRSHLKLGEHVLANNSGRVWAYKVSPWGQRTNWRKLGTWEYTNQ